MKDYIRTYHIFTVGLAEIPDWITLATIFFGGGGAVSLLTLLYNELAKKRQETIDMAKFRIEKINEKYNDYIDLIRHSFALYYYLDKLNDLSDFQKTSLFLSALQFLQITDRISKNGNFLLSNQDAESLLHDLVGFMWNKFKDVFPDFDYVKFRSLNSRKSLVNLKIAIDNPGSDYNKYYDQLLNWLSAQSETEIRKTKMVFKCISEFLNLELNIIFHLWYNKKFKASDLLKDETIQYLMQEHNFSQGSDTIRLRKFYPKIYNRLFF